MSNWNGGFDRRGSPTLKIGVSVAPSALTECEALIDTGFTGFLLLPISKLDSFDNLSEDFQLLTLADGTKLIRLRTPATIVVEGENISGIAVIEPDGNEVIIGMKFLRIAKRSLHVIPGRNEVLLIEDVPSL
jgi:predicted aspartyl protease